ncbi:hypothetical protein CR513_06512, partial [Mucuna pruriens]
MCYKNYLKENVKESDDGVTECDTEKMKDFVIAVDQCYENFVSYAMIALTNPRSINKKKKRCKRYQEVHAWKENWSSRVGKAKSYVRLQRIQLVVRWELRFMASYKANLPCKVHQRHVPLGGLNPLLLVGKRTTGVRVASSPDSDLE